MAGQRGTGANAGLIARQAAQQGAATQQNAAGQAATLRAQEILNARQQVQNQQQMEAGLSTQEVGQQTGAVGTLNQAAQSEQQNLLNAINQSNAANINNAAQQNSANAGVAAHNAASQAGILGGGLQGMGQALPLLGKLFGGAAEEEEGGGEEAPAGAGVAKGGEITKRGTVKYASGGDVASTPKYSAPSPKVYAAGGPVSNVGQFLYASAPSNQSGTQYSGISSPQGGRDNSAEIQKSTAAGIGSIANFVKPSGSDSDEGGLYGDNNLAGAGENTGGQSFNASTMAAKGGKIIKGEQYAAKGKEVPGKAKVKGDSYKNDNVKALLSPGEIILPRSIAQSPNAAQASARFVAAIKAKKGNRGLG